MDVTRGRVLRGRYAAVTDVSIGACSRAAVRTARHCRYRARGLTIGLPVESVYGLLQSLHVSSGVRVLPDRVAISSVAPAGACPCHLIAPQVATDCASRTSEV